MGTYNQGVYQGLCDLFALEGHKDQVQGSCLGQKLTTCSTRDHGHLSLVRLTYGLGGNGRIDASMKLRSRHG